MPNIRSLVVPAALLAAAACDDGQEPTVPEPDPVRVVISPRGAAVGMCEPPRLEATVTGGEPGASRAVVWESRAPDAIAVGEDGALTQVGEGDAWIVARAVADPAAADSIIATTRFTTPTLVIRIDRITTGPDSVAVTPDSVSGTIDVVLAVDGGTPCTVLERIDLVLDDEVIASRPAQSPPITRVISLDTRALDPLDGMPRWPDGEHRLQAWLRVGSGQAVASPVATLTFRNGLEP